MNQLSVTLLSLEDSDRLFTFEEKNREYFERIVLPRPSSYYDRDAFQNILVELVKEQQQHLHYMYLVSNGTGEVIGRINLTDVVYGSLKKAELGYRIDEQTQGNGVATKAVSFVLHKAKDIHKLHRIEASTSPENLGSQTVLKKNGFRHVGTFQKYFFQEGQWMDSLIFEKILD